MRKRGGVQHDREDFGVIQVLNCLICEDKKREREMLNLGTITENKNEVYDEIQKKNKFRNSLLSFSQIMLHPLFGKHKRIVYAIHIKKIHS
jgi:hypothetical protein